jgi:hypothetical protein
LTRALGAVLFKSSSKGSCKLRGARIRQFQLEPFVAKTAILDENWRIWLHELAFSAIAMETSWTHVAAPRLLGGCPREIVGAAVVETSNQNL